MNDNSNKKTAIGIRVREAREGDSLGASKFFGSPTIPNSWLDKEDIIDETVIFFCQIRLEDIAEFDKENRLPHEGYLYIFLDTKDGPRHLSPIVHYSSIEPDTVIDEFNTEVPEYEKFTKEWIMEFYESGDDEQNTRLFGVPWDWNYEKEPPKMFMQFDPLDSDMGFLDYIDGMLYFFFYNDYDTRFNSIYLHTEYT